MTTQRQRIAQYVQVPVAVVGLACRLPGNNNSPTALWDFLANGGCADTTPPKSRFNFKGHYDGSGKPKTMRSPGGMFLENIDPRDFDASFFKVPRMEATAMDPQQRQLLEVVYEGLENAGITLQDLNGQPFGCFVGSYASDYGSMQERDPEDRAATTTVGIGRAMLSNRISHFLNIKGPSMTIDTACSGSLIGVDVACRYIQSGEICGAIVAGCNMYLSPEHTMDYIATSGAASASGRCHTFDAKADGYIKSEAVNMVLLKRLDYAITDGDPIRAVIRGSATNSDGWTAGIASPNAEAQAAAIRQAYSNAGISDLSATSYLECHGTGTQAGDPVEAQGAASVFSATRQANDPLIIGSIKSNIGHSEPAAGISGLIKAILAMENGIIPGNPTFEQPNPNIDFDQLKLRVLKTAHRWPNVPFRRASVNSFGYGGSNAHVVLEDSSHFLTKSSTRHISSCISASDDPFAEEKRNQPFLLVFSANDEQSLGSHCRVMANHLINPAVSVQLRDLAYTLSERRTWHYHRAYILADSCRLDESSFVFGKMRLNSPHICFVFTGQGAQWPEMGKGLFNDFPNSRKFLTRLDKVLQSLPEPPHWSLLEGLVEPQSPEWLQRPELSQPLVTALQLVMLDILNSWGVHGNSVVGHSSGEIAAAAAAGYLTPEEAIKIAYYRGKAASDLQGTCNYPVGMLAVGLGIEDVQRYISEADLVEVACINSPKSVTLSGSLAQLRELMNTIQNDSHFARLLRVDLAYHSTFMWPIATHYQNLLKHNCGMSLTGDKSVTMFSSVTGQRMKQSCDVSYWVKNMTSPVLFSQAVQEMVSDAGRHHFVIEIGPSGALAGPVSQIKEELKAKGVQLEYVAASKRGSDSANALLDVAGRVFVSGVSINLSKVNEHSEPTDPSVIVDLPNYSWNHSVKHYWHESESSKDWRFRKFPHHDLLGSKVLGTSWNAPSFSKILRVHDLSWLNDHRLGSDIVFPAAGYMTMAIEALYQKTISTGLIDGEIPNHEVCYRLRDVRFERAMVLEEQGTGHKIMLSLVQCHGPKDSWHEFRISSLTDDTWNEHCRGLVSMAEIINEVSSEDALRPLEHPTPALQWYKAMRDAGYSFGPAFQRQVEIEAISGRRQNRASLSFLEPSSPHKQSPYPMHPVCLDGCLQAGAPPIWQNHRSSVNAVLIPAIIDELTINSRPTQPVAGIAIASADYLGVGRCQDARSYKSNVSVYDNPSKRLLLRMSGLRYHKLDTGENLHASHAYTQLSWRPDVSFLTQDQLLSYLVDKQQQALRPDENPLGTPFHKVLDVVAHKYPNLSVVEINMLKGKNSVWLDDNRANIAPRIACRQYTLASMDAAALLETQERYSAYENTDFDIIDLTKPLGEFEYGGSSFDLAIIKLSSLSEANMWNVVNNARRLLCNTGYILLVGADIPACNGDLPDLMSLKTDQLPDPSMARKHLPIRKQCESDLDVLLGRSGYGNLLQFPYAAVDSKTPRSVHFASLLPRDSKRDFEDLNINLVHFSDIWGSKGRIRESLVQAGWQVQEHDLELSGLQPRSNVLILDELYSPILSNIGTKQWETLRRIVALESRIMWITAGSQLEVTHPDRALIHGFGRSLRAEDPGLVMMTLDLQSNSTIESSSAMIPHVLRHMIAPLPRKHIESEFCERNGVLYISRVIPDDSMNKAEKDSTYGTEAQLLPLHDNPSCVRLECQRPGTLDSLHFAEASSEDIPLNDGFVEVDIYAAALNFKDIAIVMGLVPGDQHLLGLEGGGVVRRIGRINGSVSLKVGDRVLVSRKGSFANRVQAPIEAVHPLPESMSYEDAATLSVVYLVSLYGLVDLANARKGHRVLIHSAAGGVGIAAMQLCQYLGAEIYATVGNDEKRNFLIENFQIPPEHIFSSRSAGFAGMLMNSTKGKGVDVILNSLSGDLLDESWRCIADGGTMIEIGKQDMLNRSSLSMEPFTRNASYRAIDISHDSVPLSTIARLLSQIFKLVEEGHIRPIHPRKIFSFAEISDALRYMRGGNHIGKIVISDGTKRDIRVPIRPVAPTLKLRSDVSYVIIGGLRGLCGSLAIYLARHGARYLTVMSRSGYNDSKSQTILFHLHALKTHVDLIQGDVSNLQDVQQMFKNSAKSIAGIIHGAMVLRDKIFGHMSVEEFHDAIRPKVLGAWNLHNTALQQPQPLTFFTLLSSISGVVGQKSQANYAAANVFLDSFASYRRTLGLAACSVDLGVVEDVGYISERETIAKRLDTNIWTGINEGLLHKILKFSILQQQDPPLNPTSASQMITGIPVPQTSDSFLLHDARFSGLCFGKATVLAGRTDTQDTSRDVRALLALLNAKADAAKVLEATIELVGRQLAKSLGMNEQMEPGKALSGYGIDSLAAVEFRNWVRTELGREITTLEIVNAKTLTSLCELIVAKIDTIYND